MNLTIGDSLALRRGLGKVSLAWLDDVGIHDVATLKRLGAVVAFVRVKQRHPKASLNLLYALQGVLTDQSWQSVARHDRRALLMALEDCLSTFPLRKEH